MSRHVLAMLAGLALSGPAWGAEPAFAAKPTVETAADGVHVRFRAEAATDVEVAVLNAAGKVVRHLAAGVLGPKAPAPLKAGSLAQDLLWDGKDDFGRQILSPPKDKPAGGGPFTARVRLGFKASFAHLIAGAPGHQGDPLGLQCDAEGNLYVLSVVSGPHIHWTTCQMKVYDRQGAYVRQVMPYPALLPAEKRAGLKWFTLPDGQGVPLIHFADRAFWMYPSPNYHTPVDVRFRPDGRIVIGTSGGTFTPSRVMVWDPAGGIGTDFTGPMIQKDKADGKVMLAFSPDGATIYATAAAAQYCRDRKNPVVYRTTWAAKGEPQVFLGQPGKGGAGPGQFLDPRGLATDAAGNLYVCDNGADRVAVFSAAGAALGEIKVMAPYHVAVHPKTGAVYVVSLRLDEGTTWTYAWKLSKFAGFKAAGPAAELDLGKVGRSYGDPTNFCLDASAEPPVLWIAPAEGWKTTVRRQAPAGIARLIDRGDKFERTGTPISQRVSPDEAASLTMIDLMVDRATDEVYPGCIPLPNWSAQVFWRGRYDGLSGRRLGELTIDRGPWVGGEGVFGRDGLIYLGGATSHRFGRDGKPAPFTPGGSNALPAFSQEFWRQRGLDVSHDGHIYVAHFDGPARQHIEDCAVSEVGPDGKMLREKFIKVKATAGGVQVDREGNVYLGVSLKPKGRPVPEHFMDKPEAHGYTNLCGMLVKFPPAGGQIAADPAGDLVLGWHPDPARRRLVKARGALWAWHGMFVPHRGSGCACQTPRFSVDEYGRTFLPDVFRFSIVVLDTNGNYIGRFGGYGNQDSAGPGSAVPAPEVPLAWPVAVYATDRMAYVADTVNHRVVAVRLGAAAEASRPIPGK